MRTTCLLALGVFMLVSAPVAADDKEDAKLDPAKLVGNWTFVSGEKDGKKVDADNLKKDSVEITKEALMLKGEAGTFMMKYSVDTKKSPAQISLEITKGPQGEGSKTTGIIALKDDELKLCYPAMGGDAPKDFASKEGSNLHYFVLKRKK